MKPRVIITRRLPAAVEQRARSEFQAVLNPNDVALSADDLKDAIRSADALIPTVTDRLTAEVLDTAPRQAKIIANYGVGFNNIDCAAAKHHGIVVTNTPDVLTDDTADLAIALMFMVARRLGEGEREVRAGQWTGWRPTHLLGTRVTGKTLGIIGLGRIGRAVAQRMSAGFGMRVLYFDPTVPAEQGRAVGAESRNSVDGVLQESDFVSLHAPATAENRHLINADRLKLMPSHAYLINTARGDLVDEQALVGALRAKTIAGAALDVFEKEPVVTPALLQLDNVVVMPHLGSATVESRVAMGMRALDNVASFFSGAGPLNRVA